MHSATSRSTRHRPLRLALTIVAMSLLATGCGRFWLRAPSPDIQTAKASARGLYRATVRPDVTPIPVRRLQRWTLHLDTIDGRPVDTATISIDGGMPQHGPAPPARWSGLG